MPSICTLHLLNYDLGGRFLKKQAIVIGGSIAGKLMAQALSTHFQKVIVIEKDKPAKADQPRQKIPQSYHLHFLLRGGELAIEQLFPGFQEEIIQYGAIRSNFTRDCRFYQAGKWKQRHSGTLPFIQLTRPLLEWYIEHRLAANERVETLYETYVHRLIFDENINTVQGIEIRQSIQGPSNYMEADLIVDSSGFGSRFKGWLPYQDMEVQTYEASIQLFYASRIYRLKPDTKKPDWTLLMSVPNLPHETTGAYIQYLGEDHYFVTYSGYFNVSPPRTNEEFIRYAEQLSISDVHHFLSIANPISEIYVYQLPSQIWHRVDKAPRFPENFLLVGDALCRFDPIYGQGMSVTAKEAFILRNMLEKCDPNKPLPLGFSRRYQKKIAQFVKESWNLSTSEVMRHPEVQGKRSWCLPLRHWYSQQIYHASAQDSELYDDMVEVLNLLKPSYTLIYPKVLWKVFKYILQSK